MKLLLGASFLIALRNGDAKAEGALRAREGSADELGASRLTQYELLLGATHLWRRHNDATELAWLDDVFNWVKVYEVDADSP